MKNVLGMYVMFISINSIAQVEIHVNLNMEHSVNGISEFDRSKFMILHADINDNEWDSDEQRRGLLEDHNVYLGRNNGGIVWEYDQVREDPNKPGWPDLAHMKQKGASSKSNYASKTSAHLFENRVAKMVIGGQPTPMFPNGQKTRPNSCCSDATPWAYENFDAVAEYYANYLKEYFADGGTSGSKRPTYLEVLNEPFVHANGLNTTNAKISEMHNVVAKRVKQLNPNVKVGGYTAAHPAFEDHNFGHWNSNWKLFIDVAGANMNFFSFHLYDFRGNKTSAESQRKGSNIEAIMDMIDHYSVLKLGERKPWYISEYGYLLNEKVFYNKQSDWYQIRSYSSMMMQLMERQDQIIGAIPFMILKALWGTSSEGIPYGPRLLRQKKEVAGFEGNGNDWVYTDLFKFFQLWKDVKGTRVDSYSNHADIQADAYVDGDKAVLILNNLVNEPTDINLTIAGAGSKNITNISAKYLHANNKIEGILEELDMTGKASVELDGEATMILTYTFDSPLELTETSMESKHYANKYLQPIMANQAIEVSINGITKGNHGEAVLRIGIGRDHGLTLLPQVKVNDKSIQVPANWKGDEQKNRSKFFGVMEIPVGFDVLEENNIVSITFPDGGGHVSSIAMQVFNQSTEASRPEAPKVVTSINPHDPLSIEVYPNPVNDKLKLKLPKTITTGKLKVYTLQGKRIAVHPIGQINEIDIKHYRSGIYLLKIETNSLHFQSKFVVD